MSKYIDVDVFIKSFREALPGLKAQVDPDLTPKAYAYLRGGEAIIEDLTKFPAADVAPVVHGRWQSYESLRYVGADGKGNPKYRNIRIYYCSQCGHCSIIRTKGCPNCRAKMDKEVADETCICQP